MIRYFENRVWFLGARILTYGPPGTHWALTIPPKASYPEWESVAELPDVDARTTVHILPASLWTDDDEYPDALVVHFDASTKAALLSNLGADSAWPVRDLRVAVHATGFLHVLTEHEVLPTEQEPEELTEILAESLDRAYPLFRMIVEKMHEARLIRKSATFHFGVPLGEASVGRYDVFGAGCSAFDGYSYNQNFVVESERDAADYCRRMSIESEVTEIAGYKVRAGRAVRVWWAEQAGDSANLDKALAIDTLQLSQLVAATTAQTAYAKLLLRVARQEKRLDPDRLRSIMDLCNGMWQHLMLFEWRLSEAEGELLARLKDKGWVDGAKEQFRSAEANLTAATEGQEALVSRQLSRATESVILVLTILSVYSVASDVAAFLGNREDLGFPSPPGRLAVIIAVTAIVALILVLVRQRSSRKRRPEVS